MKITINRAPVLTLWAAVVAERLGFERQAALTLGRAVAGLTAQSKARWLGMVEKREKDPAGASEPDSDLVFVNLFDRSIPALQTETGLRAAEKGKAADPEGVGRYLNKKFGQALPEVERAMRALAASWPPDQLAEEAYALYQRFRPKVERGAGGWGSEGVLDLDRVLGLRRS